MDIKEKILELKKKKNAVVLAHCYQNMEIDEIADFVGDSLYLAIYISLPFILSTKLFSEPTNYLLKARHTSWRLHKS